MDEFRALLRQRRAQRGGLARLAETSGIGSPVLSRWERGETRPSPANLERLAPALGVPYEDLLKMCGYLPGAPAPLNQTLSALLSAVEAGWLAMDGSAREVAERGARALFAVPADKGAAANTSGEPTANHSGRPVNGRGRGHTPPIESHKRWAIGTHALALMASLWRPFRPAHALAAVIA